VLLRVNKSVATTLLKAIQIPGVVLHKLGHFLFDRTSHQYFNMVVLSRKSGTYSSLEQDGSDGFASSKMANDLAKLKDIEGGNTISETLKSKRVCIVGAGVAGMRCAEVLIDGGMDVTVLEARNRVGGRVCLPSSPGFG
jgi:heterodisulfide reductase subunit A-like polyferredoxin